MHCPSKKFIHDGQKYCWFARDITGPCWWSRTKAFFSSGAKLYFHVNFSRKISIVLTPNMAALATKTTEHSKVFQCNSICWFIRHIITVFLLNQCLSSYCTVFYWKMIHCYEFYTSLVISKPLYFALFRTFFPFPLGLRNSGVRLYSFMNTQEAQTHVTRGGLDKLRASLLGRC